MIKRPLCWLPELFVIFIACMRGQSGEDCDPDGLTTMPEV